MANSGSSALLARVAANDLPGVTALLRTSAAEINSTDDDLNTPLHLAASRGELFAGAGFMETPCHNSGQLHDSLPTSTASVVDLRSCRLGGHLSVGRFI